LRERKEDIAPMLDHFLAKHAMLLKRIIRPINPETMQALMAYDWPGNIRELENFARKVVALGRSDFAAGDLRMSATVRPASLKIERIESLKVAAKAASRQREREMILETLERTKWNRKRAARELQISYKALLYKLKQIATPGTGIQN
jgi:two-component system response regulator AtoC